MTYDEIVAASKAEPQLILFYGQDCAPCDQLKASMAVLRVERHMDVHELAVADHLAEARALGLRSVPTLVLHDAGVTRQSSGAKSVWELDALLKSWGV
jgi:thioredoxin-like negative regulator of GroEL